MRSGIRKWAKLVCVVMLGAMTLMACTSGAEQEKEFTAKAKQGDPEAQYQLSRLFFEGNGVDFSDKKGEFWVRKSAEQGHVKAQTDFGMMFANGLVVRKNLVEADKWLTLASRQGWGAATRTMKDLEETMSREQIEKAKALADNWKPTRPAS